MWVGIPQVVLNVVSLFVIGYIADTLGPEDYGRFVFAFSVASLFCFLFSAGLRAVTVKDIIVNQNNTATILERMIALRFFMACLGYIVLMTIVHLLGYPDATITVVAIAGLTLLPQSVVSTYHDLFQALEKMKYTAYSFFISGVFVTAGSMVIIFMGYRLIALTVVYALGSMMLLGAVIFFRRFTLFPSVRIKIDLSFWKENLRKGFPFFLAGGLSNLNGGTLLLSKMATAASLGYYGAAGGLIDRLMVIPDSVGTAIFPTIASLYAHKSKETTPLFERFFQYMVVMGVPIAVGTMLLSDEIIMLIYGGKYGASALTLRILCWVIPTLFLVTLNEYTLGAINRQHEVIKVATTATVVNLVMCFFLIPYFQENGAAIAEVTSYFLWAVITLVLLCRSLALYPKISFFLKVGAANCLMGLIVVVLKKYNIFFTIIVSACSYGVMLIVLGVVSGKDWELIRGRLNWPPKKDAVAE